jgi:hypothetical protein
MEEKINIRQFKLMNGEEIIALVTQKEPDSYIVERPFVIRANIIGGFAFLPWFPFSGQKIFKISNKHILHHVGIDEDLKHEYIRLASSVMKPKLVQNPQRDPVELLEDFEEFMLGQDEMEEPEEQIKYEDNVIPFPDPKDTIH